MSPGDSLTRFELVPYFHGSILDISDGISRAFPHFLSHIDCLITDPAKVGLFSGQSLDGIFSSHVLHRLSRQECEKCLSAWTRVIRANGHIMIHLPLNSDEEAWPVSEESLIDIMKSLGRGWDMVHSWRHPKERSHLFVFRLTPGSEKTFSCLAQKPVKTCGIVRLGAFGDMIQSSSIFPSLKAQGYHLTLYCSDHGKPVVEHDPHIDRFIVQGRNEVPPQILGEFWDYERQKYDRWINLSESVEGTLLPPADSLRFHWPDEVRASLCDRNYLEFTHEIAEVPPPYQPRFYSTLEERTWARAQKQKMGERVILWSLAGSSVHKTWPHMDAIIARVLIFYPDTHVVLVGDDAAQILEAGWWRPDGEPKTRVHCKSGVWSIRQSMAFAEVADLIVGTETGLLNAAGSMPAPKIVTLSHSSREMLTKHWENAIPLSQAEGVGCMKQPCRQLHHNWKYCNKHEETGTAMCQYHIDVEMMWGAIAKVLGEPQRMVA